MEFKGISRYKDIVEVEIGPSAENGIFVALFGTEMKVGRVAFIGSITHVDACSLEAGNLALLDKYIDAHPSQNGVLRLRTRATLMTGVTSSVGLTEGTLMMEYAPYAPDHSPSQSSVE